MHEQSEIQKSIELLQEAVNQSNDRNLIMDLIDELDLKSQNFAETIMNTSIKSVLTEKRIDDIG